MTQYLQGWRSIGGWVRSQVADHKELLRQPQEYLLLLKIFNLFE